MGGVTARGLIWTGLRRGRKTPPPFERRTLDPGHVARPAPGALDGKVRYRGGIPHRETRLDRRPSGGSGARGPECAPTGLCRWPCTSPP